MAPVHATPAQAARDFVRTLGRTSLRDAEPAGMATGIRSDHGPLTVSGVRHAPVLGSALLHLTAFDDSHPLLQAA